MLESIFGRSKSQAIDFPPKEWSFGEMPEQVDVDGLIGRIKSGENAEEILKEERDRLYNEWTEARNKVRLFFSETQRELERVSTVGVKLAEEYSSAPSAKTLKSLKQQLEKMRDQASVLEGEVQTAKEKVEKEFSELSSSETPTLAETREHLGSAVRGYEKEHEENEKIKVVRERLSPAKVEMEQAQQAYLAEYKSFQASKGMFQKDTDALKELENKYNIARLQYAGDLDQVVDERIQERLARDNKDSSSLEAWIRRNLKAEIRVDSEKDPSFKQLNEEEKNTELDELTEEAYINLTEEDRATLLEKRGEQLRERYQKIIRFKEIAKPAAEAKYETRKEALDLREKGILRRGFDWLVTKNREQEQKYGKFPVRLAKAAVSTLGFGLVFGVPVAAASAIAVAGWGGWRITKVLAGSAIGAAVGEGLAQAYGLTVGKLIQSDANYVLRNAGRGTGELNEETLKSIDLLRMGLLKEADEETHEKAKMAIRAVATVLFAGVAATELSAYDQAIVGDNNSSTGVPETKPSSSEGISDKQPSSRTSAADQSSTSQETKASGSGAPETETGKPSKPEVSMSVEESPKITAGEGADTLFYDLKSQLQSQYGNNPPDIPAVRAVLDNNPHTFARSLGFSDDMASRKMLVGENLRIVDNKLVFHDLNSGQDVVLIDSQGQVPAGTYETIHVNMLPDGAGPSAAESTTAARDSLQTSDSEANAPTNASESVTQTAPTDAAPDTDVNEAGGVTKQPIVSETPNQSVQPNTSANSIDSMPVNGTSGTESPVSQAPAAEAVSQPPVAQIPVLEKLSNLSIWAAAQSYSALSLADSPAPAGTEPALFRQGLFDLIRESGTGPNPNEDIATYTSRAKEVILSDKPRIMPVVVQPPEGPAVAHGGDLSARQLITRELMRQQLSANPNMNPAELKIIVETDPGASTRGFVVTGESVIPQSGDSVLRFESVEEYSKSNKIKIPEVTKDMPVIF